MSKIKYWAIPTTIAVIAGILFLSSVGSYVYNGGIGG